MAELMRMPEVAAGASEAMLLEWLVAPGAAVAVGVPLAVVETDKAQVEIEADSDLVVLRLLVEENRQVEVGAPIALLGIEAERTADADDLLRQLGMSSETISTTPAPERREVPTTSPQSVEAPVPPSQPQGRLFISPIARRLLREARVDGDELVGTGPGGRIVRRDVEAHIASHRVDNTDADLIEPSAGRDRHARSSTAQKPAVDQPADVVEHTRLRRAIARRLTESKQTVPHFYLKRTARLDDLLRLRAELNLRTERRISINDFVLSAAARALMTVPEVNVTWTEEAMLQFASADIAVAVASDRGLVTPVLRSIERMSLGTIATQVREMVDRANAGGLKQHELDGGTLSVTNLGMFGVDEFSAIINPPHAAILAVGAAVPQPVVVDGVVEVGTVVTLVLSVDHRAVDGAVAARWMAALIEALENPYMLLV